MIIHHLRQLRTFWSSFPNKPLWDLVPQCEEWSLSGQCPSLFWKCQSSYGFLTCKHLIKQRCPTAKTARRTIEGTHGQMWRILSASHFISSSIYVQVCHCVCMYVWRPEMPSSVIFFWSLLPWCFWVRVSHWDLGPTDQDKLAGQKPLLLSTGIIYDWPLTFKNKWTIKQTSSAHGISYLSASFSVLFVCLFVSRQGLPMYP